jgi:hypothetical protein
MNEEQRAKIARYNKAYRDANPGKMKALKKSWRETNKDKIRAYLDTNRDKILAVRRAYWEANKTEINAADRERRKARNGSKARIAISSEVVAEKKDRETARKLWHRAYYSANKEKIKLQQNHYRKASRDKINARERAYKQANRDKINPRERARERARRKQADAYDSATNFVSVINNLNKLANKVA